jgi:hypothetical protein
LERVAFLQPKHCQLYDLVKDVSMNRQSFLEAFAGSEDPLGWWLAGRFAFSEEGRYELFKKSSDAGCVWAQVDYAEQVKDGQFLPEKNEALFLELLETASSDHHNPYAMDRLGFWFGSWRGGNQRDKARSYYLEAAKRGWKRSARALMIMYKNGQGCAKDLSRAAFWGAQCGEELFFCHLLKEARAKGKGKTEADLVYSLGSGLFWEVYGSQGWSELPQKDKAFGEQCLDYYCQCVEMQQKSIWTFLLCWNQTFGVKDVGVLMAKMVWEQRRGNLPLGVMNLNI